MRGLPCLANSSRGAEGLLRPGANSNEVGLYRACKGDVVTNASRCVLACGVRVRAGVVWECGCLGVWVCVGVLCERFLFLLQRKSCKEFIPRNLIVEFF